MLAEQRPARKIRRVAGERLRRGGAIVPITHFGRIDAEQADQGRTAAQVDAHGIAVDDRRHHRILAIDAARRCSEQD
jgi:Holliday junction resolvasome RuvABC ATP-dependent DNA helicase subunit